MTKLIRGFVKLIQPESIEYAVYDGSHQSHMKMIEFLANQYACYSATGGIYLKDAGVGGLFPGMYAIKIFWADSSEPELRFVSKEIFEREYEIEGVLDQ